MVFCVCVYSAVCCGCVVCVRALAIETVGRSMPSSVATTDEAMHTRRCSITAASTITRDDDDDRHNKFEYN